MITIISGSNRENNKTIRFARFVFEALNKSAGEEVKFLDISTLTGNVVNDAMYKDSGQPMVIQQIQDDYFIPAHKFWFFVPEYNGSYPGILKLLLDSMSVREYQKSFAGKKACITGIASGRAGNLRGMDHLADVLNHLGIFVHPNKNPISSIFKMFNAEDGTLNSEAKDTLKKQIEQFLGY